MQTVTGLMIAVASAVILTIVGMPNAVFWGFLILVTSYVPIIGGMIGQFPAAAPVRPGGVQQLLAAGRDPWSRLSVVQMVVGSIIFPRMQGRSLNLDPVVVLLGLAFWGLVVGRAGHVPVHPLDGGDHDGGGRPVPLDALDGHIAVERRQSVRRSAAHVGPVSDRSGAGASSRAVD